MEPYEKLPSGKVIFRTFDATGALIREQHAHGMLDVGVAFEFTGGVKSSETYFFKRKIVSRKRYEQVRVDFPDMPAADSLIEDFGADLIQGVRAERQQRAKAAKVHVPDPQLAARIDAFCRARLEEGKHADAVAWIANPNNTLGEHSPKKSKSIIDKLVKLGAKNIWACEIDEYEEHAENSGHLVIELPDSAETRKALLKEVDRLAQSQGYDGDMDNGQRYAYVKLD